MEEHELIKLTTLDNGSVAVDGRDLHDFLKIKARYNDWFTRMTAYGFTENQDFVPVTQKRVTAQGNQITMKNHVLTLDMAKEVSMIQRNERGKQARQYFIAKEKEAQLMHLDSYMIEDPEQRALKWAEEYKERVALETTVSTLTPKANFADAVLGNDTCVDVGTLSKVIAQNGVDVGQNRLFQLLRQNGYLMRQVNRINTPTQYSIDHKLMRISYDTSEGANGLRTDTHSLVTPKGQAFFVNKFLSGQWNNE